MIPAPRPASDPPLHPLARAAPLSSHGRGIHRPTASILHYVIQKCSVRYMPELTVRQAREMLVSWAADHRAVDGRRDEVVRTAAEAGLIKSEIHRLTGIARSTLDRILGTGGGDRP